jgi:hypothetical protein
VYILKHLKSDPKIALQAIYEYNSDPTFNTPQPPPLPKSLKDITAKNSENVFNNDEIKSSIFENVLTLLVGDGWYEMKVGGRIGRVSAGTQYAQLLGLLGGAFQGGNIFGYFIVVLSCA